jgi:hypothetical protein
MATFLKAKISHLEVTLIHSHQSLLGSEPLPDEFKNKVLELVAQEGIKLILGHRVKWPIIATKDDPKAARHQLELSNGQTLSYDMVLDTTGYLQTAESIEKQDLLRQSGNLAVHAT